MTRLLVAAVAIIAVGLLGLAGLLDAATTISVKADDCVVALQWQMMMAVNGERDAVGLPPLAASVQLVQVEQARAEDLAARPYFSHALPDGSTVVTILRAEGNMARTIGEVLGKTNAADGVASRVVIEALMASGVHSDTILNPVFTRLGVGVAVGTDGMKYYAIVFTD